MDYDELKEVINDLQGKLADVITSALKELSGRVDGTMPEGLQRMVKTFETDKAIAVANTKRNYGTGGLITGVIFAGLTIGGLWWHSSKKKQKEHEKECEDIIATFKKATNNENEENKKLLCQSDESVSEDKSPNGTTES